MPDSRWVWRRFGGAALLAAAVAQLHGLRRRPGIVVDDAQLRHLDHAPVLARVDAADALARLRVLDHGDAVVDQPAEVELVVQDAVAARAVADDGRGVPLACPWRLERARHALGVELAGDRERRDAGDVFGEDPAHHRGLGLVDPPHAALDLAVGADLLDDLVPIGAAAGGERSRDVAALAAADLAGELLEELRRSSSP
jgi:hypothetical protein